MRGREKERELWVQQVLHANESQSYAGAGCRLVSPDMRMPGPLHNAQEWSGTSEEDHSPNINCIIVM